MKVFIGKSKKRYVIMNLSKVLTIAKGIRKYLYPPLKI